MIILADRNVELNTGETRKTIETLSKKLATVIRVSKAEKRKE